jgi:hypothetical protein
MSYWSGGYRKIPDQFTINMHKVSAYFLKQNFGEVNLITDSESLPYFKDIKFDNITLELDNTPKEYNETWSISKLYAYKSIAKKGDPFIHVDYDVILWKGIEDYYKKVDMFAQHIETDSYDWYEVEKVKNNCHNLYMMQKIEVNDAINVGVIGGTDLEFLYNYSDSALSLILDPLNKNFWINYQDFIKPWCKATILEQYYLAVCAKYYNKKIETIFTNKWPSPKEAKDKQYTHFMGAKSEQFLKNKIELIIDKLELLDITL